MPVAHAASERLRIGSRTVEISRLDKVLFPDDGYTKRDLIDYYRFIAPLMVPRLRDRPLMLHRFPDGLKAFSFYQKAVSDYYPDWIERVTVAKEGGTVTHALCNDAATLVYLANQACITPHVWLSRVEKLDYPDLLVLDLDPPEDDPAAVRRAALLARDLLEQDFGLHPQVMSTGSRGIHLRLALDRSADFDTIRAVARGLAALLAQRYPEYLTVEMRKQKRGGRIFIDAMRNAYAATAVAPYAVRARPGAPVAAPLDWAEVEDEAFHPRRYTLRSMQQRSAGELNPWSGRAPRPVSAGQIERWLQEVGKPPG